jgi:hypothetical protein
MIEDLSNVPITRNNMLHHISQGWDALHAYLDTLSEDQLTGPVDAAGWTVKDHMIHLAVWEDGLLALLNGESKRQAMGVDSATWKAGLDPINAAIQQRLRHVPLDEVRETMRRSHARVVTKIETMSDEDLMRPYSHYQPHSDDDRPIFGWIVGNTFGHYEEHIPWMQAIVAG